MLTVHEAFEKLLASVARLNPVSVTLFDAFGLTLAEDVSADVDSPPFDKSLMDGFAVRSRDLTSGLASLKVVEIITAGRVPTKPVGAGEASQIMTGAPIPDGADLVVKIEEAQVGSDLVQLSTRSTAPGTNILRRGTSVRAHDVVLKAGTKLIGSRIGALAEIGRSSVSVHRRPTVGVLATGDELVTVDQKPGPGQIRNSNEAMLVAQIQATGAIPQPLGIARDDRNDLREKIRNGLQFDMLILSGGVSAGMLDLVPSELKNAGVDEVFHKVAMKPGKPIWFGTTRSNKIVFGLPGNPVSSLACFELFARTAIRQMMGETPALPNSIPARLEHDFSAKADRPTYHPARMIWTSEGPIVKLVPWHGSSDLCATVTANSMAFLTGEARHYLAGDTLDVFGW